MKINSTPIPNSTHLDDTAANLVLRGEHPDKRSDKEFIELMKARGYEREVKRRTAEKQVKCINTGQVFQSMREAEKCFGLYEGSLNMHLRFGSRFRNHKELRFKLV